MIYIEPVDISYTIYTHMTLLDIYYTSLPHKIKSIHSSQGDPLHQLGTVSGEPDLNAYNPGTIITDTSQYIL